MTREQERSIAIQNGSHKVLSGETTAADYFNYHVDPSLFQNVREYVNLVNLRVALMLA